MSDVNIRIITKDQCASIWKLYQFHDLQWGAKEHGWDFKTFLDDKIQEIFNFT